MRWQHKALAQAALSRLPGGTELYYLLQRSTGRLPTGDEACVSIVGYAREHIIVVEQYSPRPLADATFYEFGAGWDLTVPLTFYAMGVERQMLVDVRPLLRAELINHTIEQFQRLAPRLGLRRQPDKLVPHGRKGVAAVRDYYGIRYLAPRDARATGLPAGSVDCITSTSTLEHVPSRDIPAILSECRRLLREDGIVSFRVDYQDHYASFDPHISIYNFLQYSERAWARYNPPLHYQNRLRHRDYVELFERAGFTLLEERRLEPTAEDLAALARLPLAKRFRAYSNAELAVRGALFVLRP
jgi:SAM-dependent methyltransferase